MASWSVWTDCPPVQPQTQCYIYRSLWGFSISVVVPSGVRALSFLPNSLQPSCSKLLPLDVGNGSMHSPDRKQTGIPLRVPYT